MANTLPLQAGCSELGTSRLCWCFSQQGCPYHLSDTSARSLSVSRAQSSQLRRLMPTGMACSAASSTIWRSICRTRWQKSWRPWALASDLTVGIAVALTQSGRQHKSLEASVTGPPTLHLMLHRRTGRLCFGRWSWLDITCAAASRQPCRCTRHRIGADCR